MNLLKMLVTKLSVWGAAATLLSAVSFAANPPASETGTEVSESVEESVAQPSSTGQLIGEIEARPTWTPNFKSLYKNEFHTENSVTLGYKFNPNTSVLLSQEFNTNLDKTDPSFANTSVLAKDLIASAKVNNIWTDKVNGLALSYEPRLYLPTDVDARDAGQLLATRQYLKLTKVFSSTFSLTGMETGILFVNQRGGSAPSSPDGKADVNRIFENRVYLIGDIKFTESLSLAIPVIWNASRFGTFAGAAFSDTWAHKLWTYPELSYTLTSNIGLGLAYMSDNFIDYDDNGVYQGFNFKQGYEKGIFQAVLRANL